MTQEAIQEVDMDVFARRIGPYFSWLESKIESGWQQSDHIQKDILKETKYLATTMRARFILGVAKPDFVKEVERTLELFELATEAFPGESDEVESKIKHFTKGIAEELGQDFLPEQLKTETTEIQIENEVQLPIENQIETKDTVESAKVTKTIKKSKIAKKSKPKLQKIKKVQEKPEKTKKIKKVQEIQKLEPKIQNIKKEIQEVPSIQPEQKDTVRAKPKTAKKSRFCPMKWIKEFIFGEDIK